MQNRLILITSLYVIFGLFEMRFGAEKGHAAAKRWLNVLYGAIFFFSGIALVGVIELLLPFHGRSLPDRGWAISAAITFAYIFLSDFVFYWYHRAQHQYKYFWVIHELHHSDTALNVTTSMRTYWLERPLQVLLITMPITLLIGIDERAIRLYPVILTVWLFFTHANLKLSLGLLTPIFCGPQLHRIHHSSQPQHQGKNFAQFFPLFDIIFGTYYAPGHDEYPATGLMENSEEQAVGKVMAKPFVAWYRWLFAKERDA